jgi:hypothetical protein
MVRRRAAHGDVTGKGQGKAAALPVLIWAAQWSPVEAGTHLFRLFAKFIIAATGLSAMLAVRF